MADFEVDAAEGKEKPKAKPRPVKKTASGGVGGGNAITIFAFVVALAAVGMCIVLFLQLQKMSATLEGKKNLKAQGTPEAIAEGQQDQTENSQYSWQDDPWKNLQYDLGDFKANTNDGKYLIMKAWLVFTSGPSQEDRQRYDFQMSKYEKDLADFEKALEKYKKDNKITWNPKVLPTGVILAVGGGEKAPAGPPEAPEKPEPPRTVMEVQLDEMKPEICDAIITLINSHASTDLIVPAGKEAFKKQIIDKLNGMIDRFYGTVDDVVFDNFLTN